MNKTAITALLATLALTTSVASADRSLSDDLAEINLPSESMAVSALPTATKVTCYLLALRAFPVLFEETTQWSIDACDANGLTISTLDGAEIATVTGATFVVNADGTTRFTGRF